MANKIYKLGELIEICDERNTDLKFGIDDVRGISTEKTFIETKANMDDVSLNSYKVVKNNEFVYVADTSRRGDKIALAYNRQNEILVSSIYTVFRIRQPEKLLSSYLFMYFNRPQFDRFARFNSWGSARETFDWADMCDIEITLPSLEIQQKFVSIYEALLENLQSFRQGLDDLKLVCDGYIENLRKNLPCEKIGKYIQQCELRNTNLNLNISDISGVESSGKFAKTRANTDGLQISNYKVVKQNQFAYNPSRINLGSIALRTERDCIVSPMYVVFEVCEIKKLLPEYLMLWFSRSEFHRSTLFYASGSVRDTFDFSQMCEVSIPIPSIEIQKSIAEIYNAYTERKQIAEQLNEQIKQICPVLIKGSLA